MDMSNHTDRAKRESAAGFARSADQRSSGMIAEFWALLRCNKKWWLLPIVLSLLVLGLLILLSSTAAAPFIYTLF